jgi:hypothetical protein
MAYEYGAIIVWFLPGKKKNIMPLRPLHNPSKVFFKRNRVSELNVWRLAASFLRWLEQKQKAKAKRINKI